MVPIVRLRSLKIILLLLLTLLAGACNLTSAPQNQLALTEVPTNTPQPSRTPSGSEGIPTTLPIATVNVPTSQPLQLPGTSIALPPTFILFPTSTPLPISIFILSPIPGNVVAGNVQVLGAAIHPQFLQYQLEYGPDPNPGNLWYPATGISQNPILNGLLGIWNTTVVQDSIYQLRLHVTLRDGTSLSTVVSNIRIQNQSPTPIPSATPNIARPIAAFTQDRVTGQAPLIVKFTNQSNGSITTYSWNFGDGGNSPEANPTHTFRSPGVYTVILTVAGPGGSSNVSRQINVQSATAPVAAFTQDKTSGPSPLSIQFTDQSTGTITSYAWTFGDSATSTDKNPLHQFVAVGTYNVILSVTGPGGTSFVTRKITVEDPVIPAPTAAFAVDHNSGTAALTVQFSNQSTGQITSYNWDFGDGNTSADTNPGHVFTAAGTYTVKLTAIGPGGQNTAQVTVTVTQPPNAPAAAFTQDKTSGDIPLAVQFTNQSTGDITAYSWNFGDGNTSTDKNPSHNFTAAGTYTVVLTVTGPGGTSQAQVNITATQPIAPPKAAFTMNPASGNAPLQVQMLNQSTGDSLTYSWNFGDGTPSSTDASPTHIFNAPGTYTVTLQVSNAGGSDSTQGSITVSQAAVAPVAAFTANPTSGTAPLPVQFTNQSTGDISTYAWDFGDGGTSADANPLYTYNNAGTFTATLTVSGAGGSNSISSVITVSQAAVAPVAAFTANPTSGTAPLPVQFTSQSTGDISTYAWDFGDGGTSADANPLYIYNNAGTFTATLTVSGAGGSNSISSVITVSQAAVATQIPPISAPITFVSNRSGNNEIYVLGTDGSLQNITNDGADDNSPAWSKDGSKIAFVSNRDGNNEIYVMNADGSGVQRLTNDPGDDNSPVWSSDGSLILFVTNRDGNNEIYSMSSADGSNPINQTNNPADDNSPAPSPDGTKLLFVSNRDGNNEIYVGDVNNPALNITNDPASDTQPRWSADSNHVIFVTDRDGLPQIYDMNADGSALTRRSDNTGKDTYPSWSSSGNQVIFVSDRDGLPQIYLMNADGSAVQRVSDGAAVDIQPVWKP